MSAEYFITPTWQKSIYKASTSVDLTCTLHTPMTLRMPPTWHSSTPLHMGYLSTRIILLAISCGTSQSRVSEYRKPLNLQRFDSIGWLLDGWRNGCSFFLFFLVFPCPSWNRVTPGMFQPLSSEELLFCRAS